MSGLVDNALKFAPYVGALLGGGTIVATIRAVLLQRLPYRETAKMAKQHAKIAKSMGLAGKDAAAWVDKRTAESFKLNPQLGAPHKLASPPRSPGDRLTSFAERAKRGGRRRFGPNDDWAVERRSRIRNRQDRQIDWGPRTK